MNYDSLLDVIEILAGAYLVFLAVKMKQTGDISHNGLISRGLDLNKAPDPQGYITVMYPWNIAMGLVLLICGIVSRALAGTDYYSLVVTVTMFAAALAIALYGYVSIRTQKRYLQPADEQKLTKLGKK